MVRAGKVEDLGHVVFECERGPWATAVGADAHSVDELMGIYDGPDDPPGQAATQRRLLHLRTAPALVALNTACRI